MCYLSTTHSKAFGKPPLRIILIQGDFTKILAPRVVLTIEESSPEAHFSRFLRVKMDTANFLYRRAGGKAATCPMPEHLIPGAHFNFNGVLSKPID